MTRKDRIPRIAIVGTVGVPGRYGGFETLAENLARYHEKQGLPCELVIYCSSQAYQEQPPSFHGAQLRYVDLDANGSASPLYDVLSIVSALRSGVGTILILGVSGTLALPLLRLLTRTRYVVNVDGLEWKRAKWSRPAAWFLRASEWAAARFANVVIADNQAIVDHIGSSYAVEAAMIPYGGDHASPDKAEIGGSGGENDLPEEYALLLCRIEPENNIHIALEAFAALHIPLIAVGNWNASEYGRQLRRQHAPNANLRLLDPIYDPAQLHRVRHNAQIYIHGHSAGGTNPSLVEMMWLGRPVIAYDCIYNRNTTDNRALYFKNATDLREHLRTIDRAALAGVGALMAQLASERYSWETIGRAYFDVLLSHDRVERD